MIVLLKALLTIHLNLPQRAQRAIMPWRSMLSVLSVLSMVNLITQQRLF